MTVLPIGSRESAAPGPGAAMDREIPTRRLGRRALIAIGAGVAIIGALLFYFLAPSGASQSVAAERLTISPVTRGVFEDFLPLRARVTPLVTVFLDAVEGGRVERLLVEDGATVAKGQLLAVLSNADLQLSTLARQTEVEQQLNNMRSQELALAQTRSANQREIILAELDAAKARRQYEVQRPLADRGFVAGRVFRDSADDLRYQQRRSGVLRQSSATDERLQSSQLRQLRASAAGLAASLQIARDSLDQLNLRAPVAGQLTAFSAQLGQSMQRGERLGQIDSPGRNKLEADVDEFYLGRVVLGQRATLDQNGKAYSLKVAKIYPQVRNGQFRVDLTFVGAEPAGVQRGQTLQARLTLSDPAKARLIPNGSFYNDTGGNWVFVVAADGRSATRRNVRLGRRNTDFVEVIDGLDPGERVITSPYTGLTDKDRLSIETSE
jgi:HlyD family secretion protein